MNDDYRNDYQHTITMLIDDIVDFADRNGVSRNRAMEDMVTSLTTLKDMADLNRYRPAVEG